MTNITDNLSKRARSYRTYYLWAYLWHHRRYRKASWGGVIDEEGKTQDINDLETSYEFVCPTESRSCCLPLLILICTQTYTYTQRHTWTSRLSDYNSKYGPSYCYHQQIVTNKATCYSIKLFMLYLSGYSYNLIRKYDLVSEEISRKLWKLINNEKSPSLRHYI